MRQKGRLGRRRACRVAQRRGSSLLKPVEVALLALAQRRAGIRRRSPRAVQAVLMTLAQRRPHIGRLSARAFEVALLAFLDGADRPPQAFRHRLAAIGGGLDALELVLAGGEDAILLGALRLVLSGGGGASGELARAHAFHRPVDDAGADAPDVAGRRLGPLPGSGQLVTGIGLARLDAAGT